LPLFERLLKDSSLEVRLFFTDRQAPNRPTWSVGALPGDPGVVTLSEIAIPVFQKRGDILRVNVGLSRIFDWGPDVVLVYGHNEITSMLVAFLCILRRIPYAFFAEVSNRSEWSPLRRISSIPMSILVRRASVLVPASESCRKFYARLGGRDERMVTIPCVPDVEMLRARSEEFAANRTALRKEAGLQDRFVVLFVGRLVEHKGVKDLMEAMTEVRVKDPKTILLIVGYGPLEDYVKAECARMPENARHIGFVSDRRLQELYSIADLHTMPSWDEPYGVVCAEALAVGVPSVVTDTSGCVDLVKNEVNGLIIPPRNPRAIADAIVEVSTDPDLAASMRANARTTVQGFGMDHLYTLLTEVIVKARRGRRSH